MSIRFNVPTRNWWRAQVKRLAASFTLKLANITNDFTFTRSSFATRVNEQGLIETVSELGSELVQNGDFEELGSELIDYSELVYGSGGWSLVDGKWVFDDVSSGRLTVLPNIPVVVGEQYEVVIDVSIPSGNANLRLTSGTAQTRVFDYTDFVDGVTTFTATVAGVDGIISRLYAPSSLTDNPFTLNSISVKKIDPNDDWSFSNVGGSNGWRIADGRAICDTVNPSSGRNLQSTTVLTSGKTYKLTLDILQSADNMTVYVGGTVLSTALPTGTNLGYEYIINGADHTGGVFTLFAGTSDLQEVDNISIKEVLVDDIPRIDYTNSTFDDVLGSETVSNGDFEELGAELITNGDFATDSDWNKGASWSIADSKASSDGSVNSFLTQNSVIQNGEQYLVYFEITDLTAGAIQLRLGSGATVTKSYNTNQIVLEYFTSDGTGVNFYSVNGFNGSIDNISVKQVDPNDEWSKVNSTISNGKGNLDGDGQTSLLYQNILTQDKSYKVTFTISDYNGLGEASVINNTGARFYTILSNGTFTIDITHTIADGNFLFRAINGAIYSIDNVSVKEVTGQIATDEGELLLEPASTNSISYSEDFTQWLVNGTLTSNAETSPDGTQNASLLSADGILGRLRRDETLSAGTDYVVSMYVRANDVISNNIKFRVYELDSTAFLISQSVASQLIVGEWVRVVVPFTTNLGGLCQIRLLEDMDIGTSAYVWGAQVEALPYATSYIPTNGSAVTRARETCVKNNLSTDGIFGGKEGTLFLHTTDMSVVGTSLNQLSPDFRIYRQSGDAYRFFYFPDLSWMGGNIDLSNNGGELKIAISITETEATVYANGSLHTVYTYTNPVAGNLETWVWVTEAKYKERVKDFRIYSEALSDEELERITNVV